MNTRTNVRSPQTVDITRFAGFFMFWIFGLWSLFGLYSVSQSRQRAIESQGEAAQGQITAAVGRAFFQTQPFAQIVY